MDINEFAARNVDKRPSSRASELSHWISVLTFFCLAGIASHAIAVPPASVLPPSADYCPVTDQPPIDPGNLPVAPGNWWNPNRYGTAWAFTYCAQDFCPGGQQMVAAWYTYDLQGKPIWLFAQGGQLVTLNGITTWQSRLTKTKWNYAIGQREEDLEDVGSVAVTFLPDSTTQAAIQWNWKIGNHTYTDTECIYDFFRGDYHNPALVDASFSGLWYNPATSGWGINVSVGYIDGGQTTAEIHDLSIYDVSGEPVWLHGSAASLGMGMSPIGERVFKANYTPIDAEDCSDASCVSSLGSGVSYSRSFSNSGSGTVNWDIDFSGHTGYPSIQWPANGDTHILSSMPIEKVSAFDNVLVSTTDCEISVGETCSFHVSWTSIHPTYKLYEHNLVTDQWSASLGTGASGDVVRQIHLHESLEYALRTGDGGSIKAESPTVRGTGPDNGDAGDGPAAVAPLPTPFAEPSANPASDAVGAIAAEFRVDEGGNAVYRIPLAVAPGAGGVTPQLALTYSSGSGLGYFGSGFSLEGQSAIMPCRPGMEYGDNDTSLPKATASEFCLDGQRLLLWTGTHKQQGATYRTEIESFQKVVIDSTANLQNAGRTPTFVFSVYGKDGTIRHYGGANGTIVATQSTSLAVGWLQTDLSDASGNQITYQYSQLSADGERYLTDITYAGGKVHFETAARGGVDRSYTVSNGWLQRSRLVTDIYSYGDSSGSSQLRHYILNYGNPFPETLSGAGDIRPRLESIQECADTAGQGLVCYPATTFTWSDTEITATEATGYETSGAGRLPGIETYKFGDVSGDHRTDIVWANKYNTLFLSTTTTMGSAVGFAPPINIQQVDEIVRKGTMWELFDLNGDGRDDLLYASGSGTPNQIKWSVRYSNGSGFDAATTIIANAGTVGGAPKRGSSVLADVNGDGLPDLIYRVPDNGQYKVAFLKRPSPPGVQDPYAFDPPINITFVDTNGQPCEVPDNNNLSSTDKDHSQAIDMDGDSRADLFFFAPGNDPVICGGGFITPVYPPPGGSIVDPESGPDPHPVPAAYPYYIVAFSPTGVRSDGSYGFELRRPFNNIDINVFSESPDKAALRARLLDLNGDGLVDLVYIPENGAWHFYLSGSGATSGTCAGDCTLTAGGHEAQTFDKTHLVDLDGDGKLDLWFPADAGPGAPAPAGTRGSVPAEFENWRYKVYLWKGDNFAVTPVVTAFPAGEGDDWMRLSADYDGDGISDLVIAKPYDGDDADGDWYLARFSSHHTASSRITRITNGLGANTDVSYAPLTFSSVYRRDYNGPFLSDHGRGSVVFDVASPTYVVQYVTSSAPTMGDPSDTAEVQYFYRGLKVQAGGRGSLGFRRVSSYHPRTGTEIDTEYSAKFPLVGAPTKTTTSSVNNPATDICLMQGTEAPGCIQYTPKCAAGLNSVCDDELPTRVTLKLSQDTWDWRAQPLTLANGHFAALNHPAPSTLTSPSGTARASIFVARISSSTNNYDASTLTISESLALPANQFDDFGNIGQSTLVKSGGGVTATTTTTLVYGDDPTTWKLGRLLTSTVKTTRSGLADVSLRRSTFTYDDPLHPDSRKLLRSEKIESMTKTTSGDFIPDTTAPTVAKYYEIDPKGNRVATYTCSTTVPESTCRSLAPSTSDFHPTDGSKTIKRYAKATYDSLGRFVDSTVELFSDGGTGAIARTVAQVNSRNAGGDPTQITDANGVVTKMRYGTLGRRQYDWSSAGASTRSDFALCTAASCPSSLALAYVETKTTTGAPTAKTFYDRLGRPTLATRQGFLSVDYISTLTFYDERGNVAYQSEPFFASNFTSGAATLKSGSDSVLAYTQTTYDLLNRPYQVTRPGQGMTKITYPGLTTKTELPANKSGLIQTITQTKNGLGEIVSTSNSENGLVVTYGYNAAGDPISATRNGLTSSTTFDTLGRKRGISDPDAGAWTYEINDAGETIQQLSPLGTCTSMRLDGRGRLWQRVDYAGACTGTADTVSDWEFDTASYGVGKLTDEQVTVGVNVKVHRARTYNDRSQPVQLRTDLDGRTYYDQATFDQYGRPYQTFFTAPNVNATGELYEYNSQGYQYRTRSAYPGTTGIVYDEIQAMDQRGRVKADQRGSGALVLTERNYDPQTGRLTGILTAGGVLQDLQYDYDQLGNMAWRRDQTGLYNYYEEFNYDGLQRLTSVTGTSGVVALGSTSIAYDSAGEGNIVSKTNIGNYRYGEAPAANCPAGSVKPGPHAVTSLVSPVATYCYDGNGNMFKALENANLRTFTYTPYDLPSRIQASADGGSKVEFEYGPNRERIRRLDYRASSVANAITHYVGAAEVRWNADGSLDEVRRYLGGVVVLQRIGASASTHTTRQYFLTDALGSTYAVLNEWGDLLSTHAAMSFDAFGQRREADDWDSPAPWSPNLQFELDETSHHGFTGHEQVDSAGVIHMNGRIYEPRLGRFLQADPFVQDPLNSQSWNRYSYVLNNPLAFTDPTGYWGRQQQEYLRTVVAIAITVYTGGAAAGAWSFFGTSVVAGSAGSYAIAFAGGFAAGAVQTGNFRGGLVGGVSSVAFLGVGQAFPVHGSLDVSNGVLMSEYAERALASGITGGVLAEIQGDRFGHGFVSAGLNVFLSPVPERVTSNPASQMIVAAVVGGTVSEASGGRFGNGAITASFQYAFARIAQSSSIDSSSADSGGNLPQDLSTAPTDQIRQQMASSDPNDRVAAAKEAIDRFKIEPLAGTYDLSYNPTLNDRGRTTYRGGSYSTVALGPSAYVTWSQLGATLGHEIEVHVYENAMFGGWTTNKQYNQREVRAYEYGLRNATRFGNTPAELTNMQGLLKYYRGDR